MRLSDQFGVLGTSLGLIKGSVNEVSEHFLSWHSELGRQYGYSMNSAAVSGDVTFALSGLFPLTAPTRKKYLFLPTNSDWTVFFDNGILGTDSVGVMSVLAERMSAQAISVTCRTQSMPSKETSTSRGTYGANTLEVYTDKGTLRSIYCANDGGKWRFGQFGKPFDFEDLQQYSVRRISERFTAEMLRSYLTRIAIDALDEVAYKQGECGGILIQRTGQALINAEMGLEESLRQLN